MPSYRPSANIPINIPRTQENKSEFLKRSVTLLMHHGGKSEEESFRIAEMIWNNHINQNLDYTPSIESNIRVTGTPTPTVGGITSPPPLQIAQAPRPNNFSTNPLIQSPGQLPSFDTGPIIKSIKKSSKDITSSNDVLNSNITKVADFSEKIFKEVSAIRSKGYHIRKIDNIQGVPKITDFWKTKADENFQKPFRFLQKGKLAEHSGLLAPLLMSFSQQFPGLQKILRVADAVVNPIQAARETIGGFTKQVSSKITDTLFANRKAMMEDPDFLIEKADIDRLDETQLKQKVIGELIPEKLAELTDYDKHKINLLTNIWNVNKEQLRAMGGAASPAMQMQEYVDTSREKYDAVTGKYYKEEEYLRQVEHREEALRQTAEKLSRMDIGTQFGLEGIFNYFEAFQKSLTGSKELLEVDEITDLASSLLKNKYDTQRQIKRLNEEKLKRERSLYGYDAYQQFDPNVPDDLDIMDREGRDAFSRSFVEGLEYILTPGQDLEDIDPGFKEITTPKDHRIEYNIVDINNRMLLQLKDLHDVFTQEDDGISVRIINDKVPVQIVDSDDVISNTIKHGGFDVTEEQFARMVSEQNIPMTHSGGVPRGIPWYHSGMVHSPAGNDNVVSVLQSGEYVMNKQETKTMASSLGSIDQNIQKMVKAITNQLPSNVAPSPIPTEFYKDDIDAGLMPEVSTIGARFEEKERKKAIQEERHFRKTNLKVLGQINEVLEEGFDKLSIKPKKKEDESGLFGDLFSKFSGLFGKAGLITAGLLAGLGAVATGVLPPLIVAFSATNEKWQAIIQMSSSILGGLQKIRPLVDKASDVGKAGKAAKIADDVTDLGKAGKAAKIADDVTDVARPGMMSRAIDSVKTTTQQAAAKVSESRVGRLASRAAGTVRETVSSAVGTVRGAASTAAGTVRETASSAVGTVRGAASTAAGTVRGAASTAVGAVRGAYETVRGAADAFAKKMRSVVNSIKTSYDSLKTAKSTRGFVKVLHKVCAGLSRFFDACLNSRFVRRIFTWLGVVSAIMAFVKLVREWDDADLLQIILRVAEIVGSIVAIPAVAISLGSISFGLLPAILTGIGLLCGIWADRRRAEMNNEEIEDLEKFLSEEELKNIEETTSKIESENRNANLKDIIPDGEMEDIAHVASSKMTDTTPPQMHSGGQIKQRSIGDHPGGLILAKAGADNVEITAQEGEYLLTKGETKSIVSYLKAIHEDVRKIVKFIDPSQTKKDQQLLQSISDSYSGKLPSSRNIQYLKEIKRDSEIDTSDLDVVNRNLSRDDDFNKILLDKMQAEENKERTSIVDSSLSKKDSLSGIKDLVKRGTDGIKSGVRSSVNTVRSLLTDKDKISSVKGIGQNIIAGAKSTLGGAKSAIDSLRGGDDLLSSIKKGSQTFQRQYRGFTEEEADVDGRKDTDVAWPADSMVVTSPFGDRSKYISNGGSSFHRGMDIRGDIGDPVYAVMGGTVTRTGGSDGILEIEHSDDLKTRYIHLSAFNVKPGDRVNAHDLIGAVGNTTASVRNMAPHLHFDVQKAGKFIDPHKFFTENLDESIYNPQWNFRDAKNRVINYGPPPKQQLADAPKDGESSGAASSGFDEGRDGSTSQLKKVLTESKKLYDNTGDLLSKAESFMGSGPEFKGTSTLTPLERSILALTESIQNLNKSAPKSESSGYHKLGDLEKKVQEVSSTRDEAKDKKERGLLRESAPNIQAPTPQQLPIMLNTEGNPAAMATKQMRKIDHVTEHMIDSIFENTTLTFKHSITNYALGQNPFTILR